MLLLAALLLPTAVLFMLYLPPIQEAARRWSTAWLTERTGTEIHIGEIHLLFPLRIEVRDVQVGKLLSMEELATHIRLRPLLQRTIRADYVSAHGIDFQSDTTGAVAVSAQRLRAEGIAYRWDERKLHIRHIHLAGGDITVHGSSLPTPKGSTTFRIPLTVTVSHTQLRSIAAGYTSEQLRLSTTAEDITLRGVAADTTTQLSLKRIKLQGGTLALTQKGKAPWTLTALTAQADSLSYAPKRIGGQLTALSFEEPRGLSLREGALSFAWQEGMLSLPRFAFRTEHSSLDGQLRTLNYGTGEMAIDGDADIAIGYADALLLAELTGSIPIEFAHLYPTETLSATIALDGPVERLQLTRCTVSLPTAFDLRMNGTVHDITDPMQSKAWGEIEAHTYNLDFLTTLADSTAGTRITIPHDITYQGSLYYAPDTLHAQCTLDLNRGSASLEGGYHLARRAYTLQAQTDSLDLRQILPEGSLGKASIHAYLAGNSFDYTEDNASIYGSLQLHSLQWAEHTFSNATAQIALADRKLRATASYRDSLMQWSLTTTLKYTSESIDARLHTQLDNLSMRALQLADTDIRPAFQNYTTLRIDSATTYTLRSHFSDIVLSTATQTIRPKSISLSSTLTPDTALLGVRSGDLTLNASAHTEGLPWQWDPSEDLSPRTLREYLSGLQATLVAGTDNPVSNYLALQGITISTLRATIDELQGNLTGRITINDISAQGIEADSIGLTAHYTGGTLHANLHTGELLWTTPQMQLQGKANATLAWGGTFAPDSLSGLLRLTAVQYSLPAYSLQLHTVDTLSVPIERGGLTLTALPLYTTGKQPLLLDGRIALLDTPSLQLRLNTRDTDILRSGSTRETLLYGKALVSGSVTLSGPFNALAIRGNLQLRPGSSIHYIYRDAILTANNQLDNVVNFVNFDTDSTVASRPQRRLSTNGLSMNLNLAIDPTVQLKVSLGRGQQNTVALQGGGTLNLQYIPAGGLRLSGRYTIEGGEMNMNVPLLHANHMTIRSGSTVTWSGSPQNPQLNITAEERIRASVTLDGSPQSVLFITGLSLTETVEKLGLQFTLSAPENASMQNTLAALSPEERSKLAVALLTTGLYLGEGGTGKLMNTALMSILQSQLDNISRDAFRTVDVSVGIEPLPDGVSGISTRTDYSFSLAKRFWNDRIRIIIGGSVTTTGERIENDAVIDNISIEWRINPVGNQYLRFFYDKNYESILEGEIRETGVGYAYRRQF